MPRAPTEHSASSTTRLRWFFVAGLCAVALVLWCIWTFTPLREYATLEALTALAQELEGMRTTPLIVLAVYVIGGVILLPVSVTIAATGLVFGAWPGLLYAIGGTLASAAVTYSIGALIGQEKLNRLGGKRAETLNSKVGAKGLRTVIAIRIVPVAPFAVINVVLGASRVRFKDFMLGTALGMAPGILLKVLFADQLADAARSSDEGSVWTLVALALALIVVAVVGRKYWSKRHEKAA